MKKVLLLLAGFAAGYLFDLMSVPAGWLLGAMLVGAFYRLFINEVSYPNYLFNLSLAVIGISISLSIQVSMFQEAANYLLPLALTLVTLLAASWFLGKLLAKYSNLDEKTALFCCLPAGASVMMALSREYNANMSMVAAFQTVRIMMLVSTIPIVAGFMTSFISTTDAQGTNLATGNESSLSMGTAILFYLLLTVLTLLLARKWAIPIAPFLYSIVLGFLFITLVHPLPSMPNLMVGAGMALLGVIIGSRFDRESLLEIKQIGWMSLAVLLAFFLLTFVITFVFYILTPLDFITSLIAIVPAGAPQMASVASSLNLDASIVAAMQVIRLLVIILIIPMLVPFLVNKESDHL